MSYEEALESEYSGEHGGIYYVYQIKNNSLHPYCIGKAADDFYPRLPSFQSNGRCPGYADKRVQLAAVHVEEKMNGSAYDYIPDDVEHILGYSLNRRFGLPQNLPNPDRFPDLRANYILNNDGCLPLGIGRIVRANKTACQNRFQHRFRDVTPHEKEQKKTAPAPSADAWKEVTCQLR